MIPLALIVVGLLGLFVCWLPGRAERVLDMEQGVVRLADADPAPDLCPASPATCALCGPKDTAGDYLCDVCVLLLDAYGDTPIPWWPEIPDPWRGDGR